MILVQLNLLWIRLNTNLQLQSFQIQ